MANSKKIGLTVVMVVALLVLGLFIFRWQGSFEKSKISPFILGVVVKISDSELYFNSIDDVDKQEKMVIIRADTKIVKQVKDENGLIRVVDVKTDDIKVGDRIVIYYSNVFGSSYETNKIQVISEQ